MFIDTSVFIALITWENDAAALAEAMDRAQVRRTSPLETLEACAVLATRLDISPTEAEGLFDAVLAEADIEMMALSDDIGRLAVACFETYGKGSHPARLNIVDCFSYACAKALDMPLLFKGNDFSLTDIRSAMDVQ